ncbi:MAG: hypothetical protein QOF57_267 [Frankiaceae bacterium]|nr:hypothetical protein [Frankiaceae bacterium]
MTTDPGYSGTPLVRKLGIKPGHHVGIVDAPAGFAVPGTEGASVDKGSKSTAASYDVIVVFCADSGALRRRFAGLATTLVHNGALWVAWPKRASGVSTDLDENLVRAHGLAVGLVDVKVCAIDATWSGLKFVYRLDDRAKRAARPPA